MPRWASILPLVYVSRLAGKNYATQWTFHRGRNDDGLHEVELLLELDRAALGMGGPLARQRTRIWCNDRLEPVRCVTEVDGAQVALEFGESAVRATLPDGSTQTIPRDGAQFVVDGNLPGISAMIYAELHERGLLDREATLRIFLSDRLTAVPFTTAPAPNGWHLSSHRTEILLDENGVMIEARAPAAGITTTIDRSVPHPPEWTPTSEEAPLVYRPPGSAAFQLEDVTIPGAVTPIGGTLTIPRGAGPFAAVLFISGSGTHDRHGFAGGIDAGTHEIVDGLAERGFAGLRFDTRGAGTTHLGADTLDRGLESDIADARACLAFLRARPEVAGVPLFLIGHSQGATVAMVLASEQTFRGVALLAPLGRSVDEIAADQMETHGKTVGLSDEQIAQHVSDLKEAVKLVATGKPWIAGEIPDHLLALLRTPTWLQQFLAYDPPELIARVRCPVLICQGGKDFQVSPERDAELLVRAAHAAGVGCEYALFPNLDHLFKETKGPSTLAEYYDRTRRVAPELIARLEEWLRRLSA
ncbi:MAG TPA: alpha/beta fold hydrolase [Thermoanaerobaculia bacterium]|nr:alpha/beta fold hydrolase [Thermoanaerobaculia bacterium]